jgi:hypothetical protein
MGMLFRATYGTRLYQEGSRNMGQVFALAILWQSDQSNLKGCLNRQKLHLKIRSLSKCRRKLPCRAMRSRW